MPRVNMKMRVRRRLAQRVHQLHQLGLDWELAFGAQCDQSVSDELLLAQSALESLSASRYCERSGYRKWSDKRFQEILYGEEDGDIDTLRYKDDFLFHYRMPRDAFFRLHNEIKTHPVFCPPARSTRRQAPSAYQLLVLLKYIGSKGSAASNKSLASHFRIGKGTAEQFRMRALTAVLSLESKAYGWPDENERRLTANEIQSIWNFPNCVGLMDGTLLPLESRPLHFGETYFTRKGGYAINMLVVCDHHSRIIYYVVGWPGSVHDNRVWRNCKLNKRSSDYFQCMEYLLTDSAFTSGSHIVPAFKSAAGCALSTNKSAFNKLLAKPRVKSEHCIGLLKGRFPWLKNVRINVTGKKSMERICRYVKACVMLHNLMIDVEYDDAWIDEEFLQLDDDDELNQSVRVALDDPKDLRREQLLNYLGELPGTGIH